MCQLEKAVSAKVEETENADLLDRIDEYNKLTKEANRGKNTAVNELRVLIRQQDKLMELDTFKEETGTAEEELAKIIKDKVSHLQCTLQIQEKSLENANGKIEILSSERKKLIDNKEELTQKLKDFDAMNMNLEQKVQILEKENNELVNRFDKIRRNVPELANKDIDKKVTIQEDNEIMSLDKDYIKLLEARLAMSMNQQLSKVCTSTQEKELKLPHLASCGSQDQNQNPPVTFDNSLMQIGEDASQCLTPTPSTVSVHSPLIDADHNTISLTAPLMQAECISIPSASASDNPKTITILECPLCSLTFPRSLDLELEKHVDLHFGMECPLCNLIFDNKCQLEFEKHVQDHFEEQDLPLVEARGWDLGID
eukprot:GFUD01014637.1.p1 GENE.GFUD01014637.1~~GFUD01014637.1.p1  ORF type:complete len:420 (+),score=109.78 GFUD01014637.1:156-1262(+)